MIGFADWLTSRFEYMAGSYRASLSWVTSTVEGYCTDGARLTPEQVAICEEILRRLPVPKLEKYPGTASEEDKVFYHAARKPDFASYLREALNQIKTLANE